MFNIVVAILIVMAHTVRGKGEMHYNQECGTSTALACPSRSLVRNLPPGKPLNIVLLGKTGHGKSATANSIFGEKDLFNSEMSTCSVTTECQKECGSIGGREICLVDTPGTMDTKHQDEAFKEIGTSITLLPEGFDAFIIVLRIDVRITEEEKKAIELLKKLFGRDALKNYGILVFTHGDNFMKHSKKTFQEHILSQRGDIKTLLGEVGKRCALIDNTQEDPVVLRDQVIHIITLIDIIVTINDGERYSNDLFVMAQEELEAEKRWENAMHEKKRQEEIERIVAIRLAEELKRIEDCFPPDGLVTLDDGRTITIANLRIGHKACSSASSVRNLPPGKPLHIVLLGKTGHGKSATANSIFGKKNLFNSKMSSCSVTTKCQKETGIIGGRNICVVDTPGTMDTKRQDEALEEIGTSITLVPEGFDAFVIVLRVDVRLTEDEMQTIKLLKKLFGHNILLKYGILVFTHGDNFRNNDKMTFQEYILSQYDDMKDLLEEFGYRFALIDNTQEDPVILREQVIHIITLIDIIVNQNGGQRYSNDLFRMAQRELQEEKNRENARQERRRQEEIDYIVARRVSEELKKRSDCFPPVGLVTLDDGRTITIADLRIGHKVLSNAASGTLEYSEVYFFAHLNPNVSNEYINLRTFKQNLKLSPQHHIHIVRNGHLTTIAAREVKIGDSVLVLNKESLSLQYEPITEISVSNEVGVYAPITMSGTIVVNNILVSCYVDLVPPIYSHPMLWPLRQLYRLSPTLSARINAEGKDGIPNWVHFIMDNFLI